VLPRGPHRWLRPARVLARNEGRFRSTPLGDPPLAHSTGANSDGMAGAAAKTSREQPPTIGSVGRRVRLGAARILSVSGAMPAQRWESRALDADLAAVFALDGAPAVIAPAGRWRW
jgi:hypothetical protein